VNKHFLCRMCVRRRRQKHVELPLKCISKPITIIHKHDNTKSHERRSKIL